MSLKTEINWGRNFNSRQPIFLRPKTFFQEIKRVLFYLVVLLTVVAFPASGQELRGVWITTAFGIDFPKTVDPEKQKVHLDSIFADLKKRKFNAVFFQVRIRADVMYSSPFEPYHEYAAGKGKSPSYDITQYAIRLARQYGLEFHAWFNTMILRGKTGSETAQQDPSLWKTHPDWIDPRAHQKPELPNVYLNPSKPEVQRYLVKIICDFARRYDIDGIQLDDYLRYPEPQTFKSPFPDEAEFKKYNPHQLALADWRRENINTVVATLYDSLNAMKPYLRVGVTPMGIYKRVDQTPATESVLEVYQDSRAWTARKKSDYLAPQIYFHLGKTTDEEARQKRFNPPFEKALTDWAKNKNARHLYVGIGTYKPTIKKEWKAQVDSCRKAGVEGVIFYPYNATSGISFDTFSRVPSLTWKSTVKPAAPNSIVAKTDNGKILLSWKNAEEARWVNVYCKNQTGMDIVIQNASGEMVLIESSEQNEFYLSSIDRFGTESRLSAPVKVN
jgi:uncharacterized lipoprotein YddW (UPF0748 family)